MELNTSNIRNLTSLSDSDFSKIIYNIALSMGFSPEKAKQASQNTAFFRVLLSNASDSDIQNMINKVGKDQIADIYNSISPETKK